MTFRLTTSAVALSAAIAAPAWADVTAADVFANQQAFFEASGMVLSGTLNGGTLNNPQINIILPGNAGGLQLSTDPVSMVENGDGTVTITYPSPMTLKMAGGLANEWSFSADVVMTHGSYTTTASGEAGDVSYATQARDMRFELQNLMLDGNMTEGTAGRGFVTTDSYVANTQVIEGNLITYRSDITSGTTEVEMEFGVEGMMSKTTQTTEPVQSRIELALPVGGSDIMNLSAATRAGLSLFMESTGGASRSEEVTMINGDVFSEQTTAVGAQTARLRFDENGLDLDGTVQGFDFAMTQSIALPMPIEVAMDEASFAYDLPFNASGEQQEFQLATKLDGISLSDDLWAMFDAGGVLPRDPADVSFDVTGKGTLGMDLLDINALMDLMGPPPITVDEVTINDLRIAAAGAEATAKGAMSFDWNDFQTIPGMPRPQGAVTVNLNGANGLMDKLVEMGLIPAQDLMMPRMMMGMFSTPVGDDMLETVLEVDADGNILANGQPLQ